MRIVIWLTATLLLLFQQVHSQQKPQKKDNVPSQKEINDMLKGLAPEEQAAARQMLQGMMQKTPTAGTPLPEGTFSSNAELLPKRDAARLAKLSKEPLTLSTQKSRVATLLTKMDSRIPATDKTLIAQVLTKAKTPAQLMQAASIALLNGQRFVAMALSFKALQQDPDNPGFINNTAAILSQSGYPEQAIPFLRRLQKALPNNSTVLHNLGFAWLQLGELDSARQLFASAAIRNPNNPETKICGSVIEENTGDPVKGAESMEEAFQLSPDPFTEEALRHQGKENAAGILDFKELRKRITIHEFFPKGWIPLPKYVNRVASFDDNMALRAGYDLMLDSLRDKIDALAEASVKDMEKLTEKDFMTYFNTMSKDLQAGINPLSKTAAYITMSINAEIVRSQQDFFEGFQLLQNKIKATRDGIVTGEDCALTEEKLNAYMDAINPEIDSFFVKHLEDTRQCLNALCTWRSYVVGNPQNIVLSELLSWTKRYVEMYQTAVGTYVLEDPICHPPKREGLTTVQEPVIPNLLCKYKLTLPAGTEELDLSSATSTNPIPNPWGITPSKTNPMPNVTLTYGLNPHVVGEPGLNNRPYAKVSGGNISPSFHSEADDELTPLPDLTRSGGNSDELTPLPKLPKSGNNVDELTPLPNTANWDKESRIENRSDAIASRELMKRYTQRPCEKKIDKDPNRFRMLLEIGTYVAWDPILEQFVKLPDGAMPEDYKGDLEFIEVMMHLDEIDKTPDAYVHGIVIRGELEISDIEPVGNNQAPTKQEAEKTVNQMKNDGWRTIIVNGLDAGIRVAQTIRNLFD